MPLSLFNEWMAYNQLDPIGDERADWHAAMLASTFVNTMRTTGRRARLRDYLPKLGLPRAPKQSVSSMRANLNMMSADYAAVKDKPRKRRCQQ